MVVSFSSLFLAFTARVYVRHTYDAEKRRALGRWADRLDEILGGERETGRVVSFPA